MSKEDRHSDFSNVAKYKNFLLAEEMPEGAYGSPKNSNEPIENALPSNEGQQVYSAFNNVENPYYKMPPRQMDGSEPERQQIE